MKPTTFHPDADAEVTEAVEYYGREKELYRDSFLVPELKRHPHWFEAAR